MKRNRRKADPKLVLLALALFGAAALFGDRLPVLRDLARVLGEQVGIERSGPQVTGLEGPARVVRVKDGDTVVLELNGADENVRLIGIDTPEKFDSDKLRRDAARSPLSAAEIQALGEEASAFAERLLEGAEVYVQLGEDERDRYGRLLAYLYQPDPDGDWTFDGEAFSQVNLELVRAGWAVPLSVSPNTVFAGDYSAAAQAARQAERGMWAQGWVP